MFRLVRSAGGKAGAAAAAASAAAVAQPTVAARAPVPGLQPTHRPDLRNVKLEDEDWQHIEVQGERLIFVPYGAKEVDEAVNTVTALVARPRVQSPAMVIEELSFEPDGQQSGGSSATTSEGQSADEIIECTHVRGPKQADPMNDLLCITSRLLRRPGLQREVVQAMMEDPEVRDLMLGQARSLDSYLTAAGIYTPGLLPAPEDITAGLEDMDEEDLLSRIINAVSGCLQKAGNALSFLGCWLREKCPFLQQVKAQQDGDVQNAERGASGKGRGDMVLGSVMVVAVAVFCMLLVKKPIVLKRG